MKSSTQKKIEAAIDEVVAIARRVLPQKMTAAVLYGSEDLRIEQVDVPSVAADEVLLRVRLALTDGTDLKVWKRGYHAKMIQPPARSRCAAREENSARSSAPSRPSRARPPRRTSG